MLLYYVSCERLTFGPMFTDHNLKILPKVIHIYLKCCRILRLVGPESLWYISEKVNTLATNCELGVTHSCIVWVPNVFLTGAE